MQSWAVCITGTHESSFWKRQGKSAPSFSAISLSMRRLTKSAVLRLAGDVWIARAKIAPPQGCVMPINCCITFVVVAILAPPTVPYNGSASR
jgi:hypothetical protein